MQRKIDVNIDFELLEYVLITESYNAYFDGANEGSYTFKRCPLCGLDCGFKLFDRGFNGTQGYSWESGCTGGKTLNSSKFIQLYKKFKDWHAAANYIRGIVREKDRESTASIEWDMSGEKIKKTTANMEKLLDHYGIQVKRNDLTRFYCFDGIEHDPSMADATFTNIKDLCTDQGFNINKDTLYDFIGAIAARNRFNPILVYLNKCKDDTEPNMGEIERLLDTLHYEVTDDDTIAFYNSMVVKWLLGCIHIAHNTIENEYSVEFVLTFKGKQGLGKTRWANSFIPKGMYKDGVTLNLDKTDSIIQATRYWVVELGEIGSTFRKSDIDKLKGFITTKTDEYRSPYGRSSCVYPRLTAFIGTVNDETFLRDKTGNRRFVVLPLSSIDYQNDIDPVKLWGELMWLYDEYLMSGTALYMTQDEQAANELYNIQYTTKSDVEIALDDLFDWDGQEVGACTISMITAYIRENSGRTFRENDVKTALISKGYKAESFYAKSNSGKKKGRYYKLPFVSGLTLPF